MTPIGRLFAALGGVLVIVAAFVPWVDASGDAASKPLDIALAWAVGLTDDRTPGLRILTLAAGLIVSAVFIIVGAYLASSSITGIGCAMGLAIVVLWEFQELGDRGGSVGSVSDLSLDGTLGPGALLALAGALLALVAAVALRQRSPEVMPTSV